MGPLRRSGGAREAADTASDAALVTRSKRDPEVFGRLYDRYHDRIVRSCYYRLGEWSDAEDATNEIFARAFVRLKGFDDRGDGFAPWLFRIAHNEVVDRYRRRAVRAEVPWDALSHYVAPGPLPDEV